MAYLKTVSKIWKANGKNGDETPLLVIAPPSTKIPAIYKQIRDAASTGIHKVLFLVSSKDHSESKVVSIELPTCNSDTALKIDPYFLAMNAEGHIFSRNGSNYFRLDTDEPDQRFTKLTDQLELFSAAAKSAGYLEPPCEIAIDSLTSYQHFIDLVSLVRKYQIRPFFIDKNSEMKTERINRIIPKPSPPKGTFTPPALPTPDKIEE